MPGIHISRFKVMIAIHNIEDISFEKDSLIMTIDGKRISVPLDRISTRLKSADEMQRNFYKISPSGYGIHWPLIDEDLSVEGILKEFDKP